MMEYKNWLDAIERDMNESVSKQYMVELSFSLLTGVAADSHKLVVTGNDAEGKPKEMTFELDCDEHVSIFNLINQLIGGLESRKKKD